MDGGPCKIGAAVVVLSEALSIVFSDDVSSVQAFDRIVEQLMTRKQRAEEILWATLLDVLYRHGDKQSKEEERRRRERMERRARAMEAAEARGESIKNSGGGAVASNSSNNLSMMAELSDEEESNSYNQTCNSFEDDVSTKSGMRGGGGSGGGGGDSSMAGGSTSAKSATPSMHSGGAITQIKRMVGRAVLESEIDLEADELRCLEEPAAWGATQNLSYLPASYLYPEQALPHYTDPVLAIRILIECLTKLKRLNDVEQYLIEGMDREIRQLSQREQAKTFARLERQRGRASMSTFGEGSGGDEDGENLKEFHIHLNNLLRSFGGVVTRLLHLTQILRHKIVSDACPFLLCDDCLPSLNII